MYDDEERGSRCANCGKRIFEKWQLEEGFCTKSCRKSFTSGAGVSIEKEVSVLMEQYKRGGVLDPLAGFRTRL